MARRAPKTYISPRIPSTPKPVVPPKFAVGKCYQELSAHPSVVASRGQYFAKGATPFARVVCHLDNLCRRSAESVSHYVEKFIDDPQYELSWSQDVFKRAATLKIATSFLGYILDEKSGEFIKEKGFHALMTELLDNYRDEVMRKAKWPDQSTSAPSNYASLTLNAATAELIEELTLTMKHLKEESAE